MRTFKDILISTDIQKVGNDFMSAKTLKFLQKSYNLNLLKNLIIPQMRPFIVAITPSKRDSEELLFTFSNHPACVEFNKFHAKELLRIIKSNEMLQKKMNLQYYTKMRGYVPKKQLYVCKVEYIQEFMLYEKANGDFTNHAKEPRLHEIFEDIREIIRLKHRHIKNLQTQNIDMPTPYNIAQKPYKK